MNTAINFLFPNFLREFKKMQVQVAPEIMTRASLTNAAEEPIHIVPPMYIDYQTHVNNINKFKDTFTSYSIIDNVTKLLKVGETIKFCRNYVGSINQNWNTWCTCYNRLDKTYKDVTQKAGDVNDELNDCIKALDILVKDGNNKYAKRNLKEAIDAILNDMESCNEKINGSVEDIQNFQNNFDKDQKGELKKIFDCLGKEASLQEKERDKITQRIKQLNADIASYNAGIAGIAIGMGVGVALVTCSFFISGGFGFVISLFVLPIVGVGIAALIDITNKIKKAKKEIEGYGDYKSEYKRIIDSLGNMKSSVELSIKEAEGIKKEIGNVSAPWKAFKKDMDDVKEKIMIEDSNVDYEKLKEAFEQVQQMWKNMSENLTYLNLEKVVTKVVQSKIDIANVDANVLVEKAKENGCSMKEFIAA